ncbi:SCP2 sterol-binding domain-containing protein [Pullulanibacillus sp. KACC 23026]|uniref:SCP2 sterol-binding domain-containing protein n=1 Tax=Pullulanibacillus sp. KACC 23026 TaxID=3028315 RepID=UPI0023B0A943|nr:SCP2 sterol-binding domain-containing protein [Pullulanibacillus sp. KACC 23026]WEG14661.1 SCP2 sterol-binding domain-containing protein [Pullulanibacillus sp. KACC 23026]
MQRAIQDLSVDEIWNEIEKAMNEYPEPIEGINVVYQYHLKGEAERVYQLHLSDGRATVVRDHFSKPDCTLIMKTSHFKSLLLGQLSGAAAFMTGRLKVKGNMGLALKLDTILGNYKFGRKEG